jgi:hypothetical protein
MRAVDDQSETLEVEFGGECTFAKFDVATGCIVDTARSTQVRRGNATKRQIQFCLNPGLNGVGQLIAL